jgi:hypothetical protein
MTITAVQPIHVSRSRTSAVPDTAPAPGIPEAPSSVPGQRDAEFSLALDDEQLQIQRWVHDFAAGVIRPTAHEWDETVPNLHRGAGVLRGRRWHTATALRGLHRAARGDRAGRHAFNFPGRGASGLFQAGDGQP